MNASALSKARESFAEVLDRCCPDISSPLERDEAVALADLFKALADPARVQLLSLIKAQPDGQCVCNLLDAVELSQPTVSYHLKVLHEAGLLTRRRQGSWAYYRVVPERLAAIARAVRP
ncbi:MAG: ArsR/SmtB family transcription factor [Egibacteraceae bacterium]